MFFCTCDATVKTLIQFSACAVTSPWQGQGPPREGKSGQTQPQLAAADTGGGRGRLSKLQKACTHVLSTAVKAITRARRLNPKQTPSDTPHPAILTENNALSCPRIHLQKPEGTSPLRYGSANKPAAHRAAED